MKKNFFLTLIGVIAFSTTAMAQNMGVDEALYGAEKNIGKTITVEGVCSHICSHGGKKIFLSGKKPNSSLRVEADKKIGAFPNETVGKKVQVSGIVVEERIDEAYLSKWEAQTKAAATQHAQGCNAEQKAQGEKVTDSTAERIAAFRKRIEERSAKDGKKYLSFYHIQAQTYKIIK